MDWTRNQKEQTFIRNKQNSLLREKSNQKFYCTKCQKEYKGYDLQFREGYGDRGWKHYVTAYYCCPKSHEVLSEDSPLFSDTIIDHLRTVLILLAVIAISILLLRYCPSQDLYQT